MTVGAAGLPGLVRPGRAPGGDGRALRLAPISGVPLSGLLVPGPYGALANGYVRFGGYLGRNGPPPDYVGGGVALAALGSLVVGPPPAPHLAAPVPGGRDASGWRSAPTHRRAAWLGHLWLPWRDLSTLPVLKEILPDQFAPFARAVPRLPARRRPRRAPRRAPAPDVVDGAAPARGHRGRHRRSWPWWPSCRSSSPSTCRFRVVRVRTPAYLREAAPALPAGTVLLTVPFAVSGSAATHAVAGGGGMHFRLAGAALKTPNALGGPVGQGAPGSARRILTDLTCRRPACPRRRRPSWRPCAGRCSELAGRRGGHRRRQPRPGVRLGVLHRGARRRARLTSAGPGCGRLQPGGPAASAGHGRLPVAVPGGAAAPRRAARDPLAMSPVRAVRRRPPRMRSARPGVAS